MTNRTPSHYLDIGVLGEDLVAQWLQSTGWIILHRRWRCRWGEIDIVAKLEPLLGAEGQRGRGAEGQNIAGGDGEIQSKIQNPKSKIPSPLLAFVEVKTRRQNNWDAGGLLAITPKKQAKLLQAAQYFLAAYPDLAEYSCRFDVALVSYKTSNQPFDSSISSVSSLSMPLMAIANSGYQLVLQEYLPSAFD